MRMHVWHSGGSECPSPSQRVGGSRTWPGMETPSLFETHAEAAIAAALSKPLPVTGRAIIRRSQQLIEAERAVPIQRARVKVCEECGTTFQGATTRARWCSAPCRARRRQRRLVEATCPVCSTRFLPSSHRQRYCGSTCREAGRVARQRESRAVVRAMTLAGQGVVQGDSRGGSGDLTHDPLVHDDPLVTRLVGQVVVHGSDLSDPWVIGSPRLSMGGPA